MLHMAEVDEQNIFTNLMRLANSDSYYEDRLLALQLMVGVGVPEGLFMLHLSIANTDREDVFDEVVSIVGLFMQTDLLHLNIYFEESSQFPYINHNKQSKGILKKSLKKAKKLVADSFPNLNASCLSLEDRFLFFTKSGNYVVR